MTRRLNPAALAAAGTVSAIGLAASAAASADRAASPTDTALVMAFAMAATAGAHVLPAISRSIVGRVLWLACLLVVVYGHAAFLAASGHRAGDQRAASVRSSAHSQALQRQLDALGARPLSTVADALATATTRSARATAALTRCEANTPGRCSTARATATSADASVQALSAELTAARRAAELRERLTTDAEQHDTRRADAALDPGAAALATLTGLPPAQIQTAAQMLTALLVELLAALLWTIALPAPHARRIPTSSWPATAAHHPLDATTEAQQPAMPGQADPRERHPDRRRRVPADSPRRRTADHLHQPGSGRHDVAGHPAPRRPDTRGADCTERQGASPAQGRHGHGLGRARPPAVDTS